MILRRKHSGSSVGVVGWECCKQPYSPSLHPSLLSQVLFPCLGGSDACGVVVPGGGGAGKAPVQSTHLHRR